MDIRNLPKNHMPVALLFLSGEEVMVGHDRDGDVWYQNEVMREPHYLSPTDAKAFTAALQLAIKEAKGKNS